MGVLNEREMSDLVILVRQRADVPRVRSSEIRRIIETMQEIARTGEALTGLTNNS